MDPHKHLLSCRRALLVAPALLLATDLSSASPQAVDEAAGPAATAASSRLMRSAFGAAVVDGEVVAGGPSWKARFPDGRVVFTPALGTRAERNLSLSFTFLGLERGSEERVSAGGAPAELAGERISFAHADLIERYDATVDGLEQSFLIPERPGGTGDLVLRGRIETELPYAGPLEGGGLRFEVPGVGGVSVGGVTAIDAQGATAPGALRLADDVLELVVPGAFVDAATYPLVIDPKLGALITIDGNDWDDGDPDVAVSTIASAPYLVVWERRFSLSDTDIRGYRLDATGDYEGTLLYLENGDELSGNPVAAYVRISQRYFVAWQETPGIFNPFNIVGRAVDASTGTLSSKITVAASANQQLNPDVGGERTLDDNDVLVVWGEEDLGIRGRQVTLPAGGGEPFPVDPALQLSDPVAGDENTSPVISKSAGGTGRFGLAYQFGPDNVMVRTLNRNGTDLTGAQLLLASLGGPHSQPAIDGDGTNFMLVFERGEAFPSTETDIWAAAYTFTGTFLSSLTFQPLEADPGDAEANPDVAFNGSQFIVAYTDLDGVNNNAYTKTVDPFTCLICESESALSTLPGQDQDVKVAAVYAGGQAGSIANQALHVWESFEGDGDLFAQVYDSPSAVTNHGGGCGAGGTGYTPCAYAGNPNFTFHLSGAAAGAPAFLVVGFAPQPIGCGTCTLWPSLATADVFYAGVTDGYGRASFPVALPPGTGGVTFTSQWGVAEGPGACPLFGVDVSNGTSTEIEL